MEPYGAILLGAPEAATASRIASVTCRATRPALGVSVEGSRADPAGSDRGPPGPYKALKGLIRPIKGS